MVAASSSKSQPLSIPDAPAANALRHGMTATRFVPPEQDARRLAIRSQLVAVYRPASLEEIHCVDELAFAEAQLYDVEAAAWRRFEWEKAHARERFDRRMHDQLEKDLTAWRANPYHWLDILARTWQGACHIARVWAEIADTLANSESACPLERIFDAIASQKSGVDVDNVCFEGSWIIQRHLAITPDPQAEIERWFERTLDKHQKPRQDQRTRARWFLNHAPEPATARRELLAKATAERDRWTMQANDLRSHYETDRELAADRAVGFVPSDEMSTRESRLALRYLTTARNRVDKFQRRLDALLKLRPVRKSRYHNSFDETTPSRAPMTDDQTAQLIAEIEAMEAGNAALDAEIAAMEAKSAAMELEIAELETEIAAEAEFGRQRPPEIPIRKAPLETRNPHPSGTVDSSKPLTISRNIDTAGTIAEAGPRTSRRPDPASIAKMIRKRAKQR